MHIGQVRSGQVRSGQVRVFNMHIQSKLLYCTPVMYQTDAWIEPCQCASGFFPNKNIFETNRAIGIHNH